MKSLTDRQDEVLAFFRDYARREGLPPTVREVAGAFGMSPKAALDHLNAITKKGHLRRRDTPGRAAHRFVLVMS